MMGEQNILLLTGGGIAPTLNSTLYGAIKRAQEKGMRIFGGAQGYACFLDDGTIRELTDFDPEQIKSNGGSFLRTSRTNIYSETGSCRAVEDILSQHNIDYLIPIGGDDTMGVAKKLSEDGIQVIGIPKTVDNDLCGTYWTPGFITGAKNVINLVNSMHDAGDMQKTVQIVEVVGGQDAGWLAAASAYAHPDIIIPPEKTYSAEPILNRIAELYKKQDMVLVVMSESANISGIKGNEDATDTSFGIKRKRLVSAGLMEKVQQNLGYKTRVVVPGHSLMCGPPDPTEAQYTHQLGRKAVDLAEEGKTGFMVCFTYTPEKGIGTDKVPFSEVVGNHKGEKVKTLDETLFDFQVMQPRDAFFKQMEPLLGTYQPRKERSVLR